MKTFVAILLAVLAQSAMFFACGKGGTESDTEVLALDFETDQNRVLTGRADLQVEVSTDPRIVKYMRAYLKAVECWYGGSCSEEYMADLGKQFKDVCGDITDGNECYQDILSNLIGDSLQVTVLMINSVEPEVSYPYGGQFFGYRYDNRINGQEIVCDSEYYNCGIASVVFHTVPSAMGDAVSFDFTIQNNANEVIVTKSVTGSVNLTIKTTPCVGCG